MTGDPPVRRALHDAMFALIAGLDAEYLFGALAASEAAQLNLNRGNTDTPFVAFPARYAPVWASDDHARCTGAIDRFSCKWCRQPSEVPPCQDALSQSWFPKRL